MKVAAYDIQGKAGAFINALLDRGATLVSPREADVFLIDFEGPEPFRQGMIGEAVDNGALVVLYPHGACPILFNDLYPPEARIDLQFVHALGHIDVYRAQGVTRPIVVSGFSYAPRTEFAPVSDVHRVIFAPIHPLGTYMREADKAANLDAYTRLLALPDDIELTVRVNGTLEDNGIYENSRCKYEGSDLLLASAVASVDASEVVVSQGTYAYLAVARGKPTIMFGQDLPATDDFNTTFVSEWEELTAMVRYPYDIKDADAISRACAGDDDLIQWAHRFIGGTFDGDQVFSEISQALENR